MPSELNRLNQFTQAGINQIKLELIEAAHLLQTNADALDDDKRDTWRDLKKQVKKLRSILKTYIEDGEV